MLSGVVSGEHFTNTALSIHNKRLSSIFFSLCVKTMGADVYMPRGMVSIKYRLLISDYSGRDGNKWRLLPGFYLPYW